MHKCNMSEVSREEKCPLVLLINQVEHEMISLLNVG